MRILAVDKTGKFENLLLLAVSSVAGQYDDVPLVTLADGPFDGDAVNNAAIEHGTIVDLTDGTDVGQTGRCLYYVYQAVAVGVLLHVAGLPGQAVGGHHLETHGAGKVAVVVERENLFGEAVVEHVHINDAARAEQVSQSDILILVQQVDVTELRPSALAGYIRHTVAGSGTDTDAVGNFDMVVHQVVKHSTRKGAAHAASFQY